MKWLVYISGSIIALFLVLSAGYGEMPISGGVGATFAVR